MSSTTQKTLHKQWLYYEERELTPLSVTIKKALKGESLIGTLLGVISTMVMRSGIDFTKYMSTQELPKVLLTAGVWEMNVIKAYRKTLLSDGPAKTVRVVLNEVLDRFMEIKIIGGKAMAPRFIWPDKFVDSATDAPIDPHPYTIMQWGEELRQFATVDSAHEELQGIVKRIENSFLSSVQPPREHLRTNAWGGATAVEVSTAVDMLISVSKLGSVT